MQHNFSGCRQEKKEEAAMLRRQAIAAWRPCGSKLLPCVLQWVQTRSMPWQMLSSKGSRKVEQFRSRCQEEMKEEGTVKMNKSKAEPVSKWRCPRRSGSIKLHRRVVWSLIFLVFGVHLAKAEVQEDQAHKGIAREVHPDFQDGTPWMRKGMTMWEDWCVKQQRKKNSQGKDQELLKKTVRKGTPVPKKEIARVRTQGPWKKTVKVGT